MSSKLFWAPPSFEWHALLSTFLRNQLFWELFLVIYSWEQFFEPSFERWKSFEHFFEHSQECTYSQEHFFEWIYSRECSFGHFLEGSQSTRTYLKRTYWVSTIWKSEARWASPGANAVINPTIQLSTLSLDNHHSLAKTFHVFSPSFPRVEHNSLSCESLHSVHRVL